MKGNNNIQNTVSDNKSPIQNNNEKITSQQKGGMNNNTNSSNNLKEVNIKLLETEKTTNKNIYKLAFGIITLLSLAELLVIIYLVLDRKKFKNNKKI